MVLGTNGCSRVKGKNSKWILDLTVRLKLKKLLEENIGVSIHDPGRGKDVSDMLPKAQETKKKSRQIGLHQYCQLLSCKQY